MIRRVKRMGRAEPAGWVAIVTPRGRCALMVGVYAEKSEARAAHDAAGLWLCYCGLQDPFTFRWELRPTKKLARALNPATMPACPDSVARWLTRRGWQVRSEPAPIRRTNHAPLDQFMRRLAAIESRLDFLTAQQTTETQHARPEPEFVL